MYSTSPISDFVHTYIYIMYIYTTSEVVLHCVERKRFFISTVWGKYISSVTRTAISVTASKVGLQPTQKT